MGVYPFPAEPGGSALTFLVSIVILTPSIPCVRWPLRVAPFRWTRLRSHFWFFRRLSDFEDLASRVGLLEGLFYLAKEKSSEWAIDII
jgi:hypothetical protein